MKHAHPSLPKLIHDYTLISCSQFFYHSLAPSASGNSIVIRAAFASLWLLPFLGSAVTEPTSSSSRMPRCARVRENLTRQDLFHLWANEAL